jgi:predicted nucleic acid-binding protein
MRLPDCRDPDDQKFLELARACGADFLVSRDRALLEIGRRKGRPLPFAIVTPAALAHGLEARA